MIVAMGSMSGTVVDEGFAAYAATKGAVLQLARGMAADLAPRRIRVNVVAPGNCETPMNDPFLEGSAGAELRAELEGATPLGRLGTSADRQRGAVLRVRRLVLLHGRQPCGRRWTHDGLRSPTVGPPIHREAERVHKVPRAMPGARVVESRRRADRLE